MCLERQVRQLHLLVESVTEYDGTHQEPQRSLFLTVKGVMKARYLVVYCAACTELCSTVRKSQFI